jgi:hypothetical protein
LEKNGIPSNEFKGTQVEGDWEIRSMLTKQEKANPDSAPEVLWIKAFI